MKHLLASLAFLSLPVYAQPCMPYVDTPDWIWSTPKMGVTKNGAWIQWDCWSTVASVPSRRVTYVGTVPEFSKVGGRVATIVNAANPLKSLQTLPKRITVLPLTDPSLAAIVADAGK